MKTAITREQKVKNRSQRGKLSLRGLQTYLHLFTLFYEGILKVQIMIVKITQLFPWLGITHVVLTEDNNIMMVM